MSGRAVLSPPEPEAGASRRTGRSDRRLRALAVAATATTFLLIAVGALVRATGSGLGCTGWPKCSAHRWLPPLEYHAIIEYSHRFTAFLDIVLVGLLVVAAWRGYRGVPRVFLGALGAVVLVVFQAILGGIVVKGGLEALLVTAHLGTAMLFAGVLVYVTVAAFTIDQRPPRRVDGLTALALWAAGATFVLIAVGAYVRGEGAGLAFSDWPLMDGRLVPSLSHLPSALHFAHRALATIVAVSMGFLAVRAWRERTIRRPVAVLALVAAGLLVVQIFVGAANVWTRLAPAAVVAHVAVAGLTWGAVVATVATAHVVSGEGLEHQASPPMAARSAAGARR